jgi:hypothetical protein
MEVGMRVSRRLVPVLSSLSILASLLLAAVPASAASSSGLEVFVGRPGTSWSDKIQVTPGDGVNVLIKYTNLNAGTQKSVVVTDILPQGAVYSAGSTFLFAPGGPASGTKQQDKLTSSGIPLGTLTPGAVAFIQFTMTMPKANALDCGKTTLMNRATAAGKNKSSDAGAMIVVNRQCAQAPTTTPTQPATPTTHNTTPPTSTTNVSVVNIDASTTTIDNSFNTASNTTTAQVQTASTTTAGATTAAATNQYAQTPQTAQTANTTNAKTLVNTGVGSMAVIFLVAVVVGTFGSRFVLYRMLGA